ncbi:hypothetical protein BDB00DRAFT_330346 [Zychaea mexicana]|uniref:uncharacterized protein n=1 Tax=Zychaea mexicana TaxID=64656 RepID=UPI0022FF25F5|nr:uncharacterized protein BDB00DRAFT_330346 [Zychaea mexicana]KAI9499009.1 hypothetical protein BDB00DRAFT_330346 [Zychaea mexicana]
MPRNTPCRDCKKRRRRCVWQENSTICTRCARLGLDCAPFEDPSTDEDDLPAEDGTTEIQLWLSQISIMEKEMREIERYIQQSTPYTMATPLPDTCSIQKCSSYSTLPTPPPLPQPPPAQDELVDSFLLQQQPEWDLSIVDGKLRLETGIKSVDELMKYMQASLRYLSPFANFFQAESVRFESISVNVVIRALRLISQKCLTRPLVPLSINRLPVLYDHRAIIDQLVTLYMKQQHHFHPFLHAPSYFSHYRRLKDPMSCPITLAVCVLTVCSPRRIVGYTAVEKRQLAEFFYVKCKEMLMDMFDDPLRKLETITVISLTQHFTTFVLLQFTEARRLSTIAYLLCQELYPLYTSKKMPQEMSVVYERNFIFAESFMRILDMMIEDKVDDNLPTITRVVVADDEDDLTAQFLCMYNHMLRLSTSPYMATLLAQIKRILTGLGGELSIEVIVRLTDQIKEWWSSVPKHLRLSEDPFPPDAKELVAKCDSMMKLTMFMVVNVLPTVVNSCLLKPAKTHENADILMMMRERAMTTCLRSCEIVLLVIKRRFTLDDDVPPLTFEMLVNVMYALSAVASCAETTVSADLQRLFHDCFNHTNSFFPSGHRIPPSLSPLKSLMTTQQVHELDIYERYPLPGYALISDVFNQSFIHIQSKLHGSSSPTPMNIA